MKLLYAVIGLLFACVSFMLYMCVPADPISHLILLFLCGAFGGSSFVLIMSALFLRN